MGNYGKFDNQHKEYVITNPRTPRKWINYIGNMDFGGFVDHTGGSLICKGDPGLNRITRYIAQLPASDFKGETLYVRTQKGSGYNIYKPFLVPGSKVPDQYECRVGLGYTRILSVIKGIQISTLIFVPPGASCEIRKVTIKNFTQEDLTLDLIPVVEYSHFDALKQFTNADWVPQTMQSAVIRLSDEKIILKQCAFMKNGTAENYFCTDQPVSSFETDRVKFLGDHEYGTWSDPASLSKPALPGSLAQNGDNIAALLVNFKDLHPGEERTAVFQLGQVDKVEDHIEEILQWFQPGMIDSAFQNMSFFWENYLSAVEVHSPDDSFNTLINIHNPRQCYTTKTWSRYLSLYQLGYGSRGVGVRDSSQDVMGVLASVPDEARSLLRMLMSVQRPDGSAMHQFYPLTLQASVGDASEYPDRPHYYCDDHLWIVLAVCEYLKETGDFSLLEESLPYYAENESPHRAGTVWEHLDNALYFSYTNTGKNGIPLLGFADWNDTINLPTGAESLLAACLFGKACLEMMSLCEHLKNRKVDTYREWYMDMKSRYLQIAWDGEWFRSYLTADGKVLGSAENQQGKIFAYSQAWPILAGFADAENGSLALESVHTLLNTSNGIKLSAPGFDHYEREIGGITTYPPGAKENGGIFVHVNPWVIIAETMLGNGDRAYEYFTQVNPVDKNNDIDSYEMEPYVFSQNILGDEHPKFGMARNSWLSGTATWMYQAAIQSILGIKPTYAGLSIQPCIPRDWQGFTLHRTFQGAHYEIEVDNPGGVSSGIREIFVDGQLVKGNIVPHYTDKTVHQIRVVLG